MKTTNEMSFNRWMDKEVVVYVYNGILFSHNKKKILPSEGRFLCVSHSVVSDSLWPHGLYLTRLLCPWKSPGKITGVGCHFLLQGIFPTQGSNLGLLHCRQILYCLSYQGSPWGHDAKWNKCGREREKLYDIIYMHNFKKLNS